MKRYCLWVKSLCYFLAVVTLLCVAVSTLGILFAESESMYTHDDYEQWIYSNYHDRANVIADQVMLAYGSELSDCPQWVLAQTGHLFWPIPVLVITGLCLIVLGFIVFRRNEE